MSGRRIARVGRYCRAETAKRVREYTDCLTDFTILSLNELYTHNKGSLYLSRPSSSSSRYAGTLHCTGLPLHLSSRVSPVCTLMVSPTFLNFPLFSTFMCQIQNHTVIQKYHRCIHSFTESSRWNTCERKVCGGPAGVDLILGWAVTDLGPLFVDFPSLDFLPGVVFCSWASVWQ